MDKDKLGRQILPGLPVIINVSGDLTIGRVEELREHPQKSVRVIYSQGQHQYTPALHDLDLWTDPVERWLIKETQKSKRVWYPADKILVAPEFDGIFSQRVTTSATGPLKIDWSRIPAGYNQAAMDQDMTVWVFDDSELTLSNVERPDWTPNMEFDVLHPPFLDYWDMDLGFWCAPESNLDRKPVPWVDVLSRPHYSEWFRSRIERPKGKNNG